MNGFILESCMGKKKCIDAKNIFLDPLNQSLKVYYLNIPKPRYILKKKSFPILGCTAWIDRGYRLYPRETDMSCGWNLIPRH